MEDAKEQATKADDQAAHPPAKPKGIISPHRELKALVAKANKGDVQALNELREKLDHNPAIWQRVGDMGAHAEQTLIALVAGNDTLLVESLKRKLDALRQELTGAGTVSLIERLGIDRVILCWLETQHLDIVANTRGGAPAIVKYWRSAQDQAHRRYLGAMRSLVTIRQLAPAAPRLAATG